MTDTELLQCMAEVHFLPDGLNSLADLEMYVHRTYPYSEAYSLMRDYVDTPMHSLSSIHLSWFALFVAEVIK